MGFAQEPLGRWFSDLSVLKNDPKNFLEVWGPGLVSGSLYSWVWIGPRNPHFHRFPMASGTGGLQTPSLRQILPRERQPSSRLGLQGSASPGGLGFLGFVLGHRYGSALSKAPNLFVGGHPFHYFFTCFE